VPFLSIASNSTTKLYLSMQEGMTQPAHSMPIQPGHYQPMNKIGRVISTTRARSIAIKSVKRMTPPSSQSQLAMTHKKYVGVRITKSEHVGMFFSFLVHRLSFTLP
jgi:hypothetical protein